MSISSTIPRPSREPIGVVVALVMALGLAVAGVVDLAEKGQGVAACSKTWEADPATATPIRHLFVIVKENHAFENYFGDMPGVTGYPPNGSFPSSFGGSTNVSPYPIAGYSTPDLPHDAGSDLSDYDHGHNDLFVAQATADGAASPASAVGYYTPHQIPAYYAYARNYTLGDRFFTGVLGPTYPNRVFDLGASVGSWNADSIPPGSVTDQPTILGQLTQHDIPWYYDYAGVPYFLAPLWFPSLTSDPCSSTRIVSASDLAGELAAPAPPSVVYLDPSNSATYSEHPPGNVSVGEAWTVAAVNTIFDSPVANSSAVVIFFDENGGYWDPVPPPMTSTGLDGFRVPFLVLSPWTPAGKVCSGTVDPASLLDFIDTNWGLPPLTPRIAEASNLSCFFDFAQTPRAPLILPTSVSLGAPGLPAPQPLTAHPAARAGPSETTVPSHGRTASPPFVPEAFWPSPLCATRQEAEGS